MSRAVGYKTSATYIKHAEVEGVSWCVFSERWANTNTQSEFRCETGFGASTEITQEQQREVVLKWRGFTENLSSCTSQYKNKWTCIIRPECSARHTWLHHTVEEFHWSVHTYRSTPQNLERTQIYVNISSVCLSSYNTKTKLEVKRAHIKIHSPVFTSFLSRSFSSNIDSDLKSMKWLSTNRQCVRNTERFYL